MKPFYSILVIVAFLSVGCDQRPDELEQKSFQLTNGLTITGVSNLFSGFPTVAVDENGQFTPAKTTRCFQTNQPCAKTLMYKPKKVPGNDPLWFEWCEIWFDTNGVIVAYEYQIGD
jgi:hypothetical protein